MAEHSQREEMNAAIRAQRERRATPRLLATGPPREPELPTAAEAETIVAPKHRFWFLRRK